MIVAVFEWDDGYAKTVTYPKKPRGLKHNGARPDSMKILVKDAKAYNTKMSEWFSICYSIISKKD